MISDSIKKPPTVSVKPAEVLRLDEFIKKVPFIPGLDGTIQVSFSRRQWDLINTISTTFLWIINLLSVRKVGIGIIRKVLNISLSPITAPKSDGADLIPDSDDISNGNEDPAGKDSMSANPNNPNDGSVNNGQEAAPPKKNPIPRPNHHGRRNSDNLKAVNFKDHGHPEIKAGDPCMAKRCRGRVYPFLRDGKPREVITFDFSPPFQATVHRMNDLRCNFCFRVYKAPFPEDLIQNGATKGRYLYPAQAALVILHFGMGMPFYRLDQFHSLVGERFPESTQFSILENVADFFKRFTEAMVKNAANGFLVQGDDVSSRIQDLTPELRERRSNGQLVLRDGVHTSLLISTTAEGNLIPVLKTGLNHFGELLDEVLGKRSPGLPSPHLVCDGSKVNQAFVLEPIKGGCWEHLREYFIKAKKNFPIEGDFFVGLIKKIFEFDRDTHSLSAEERLEYLKEFGLPLVEKIKNQVDELLINKTALPKSELGQALQYFDGQYRNLLMPFEYPGIPIHNNLSEWCTYLMVRYLVNSKQFKNKVGAAIGDTLIMVILFSYLSSANPYEFILYCLRHREEFKKNPEDFFPWKLREKVGALPEHKQMRFWAPAPPLTPSGLTRFSH